MTRPLPRRRFEADREDLMREATALRQRAEFRVSGEKEAVIAGYRSDGSLSAYFGADPCYHLDPLGRLRRAFVGGDLYRTQGTTLARLQRVRTIETVVLHRHDLSPDECDKFLELARDRLSMFTQALHEPITECLQQVPSHTNITARLSNDLTRIVGQPLTLAPEIRGKR